MKKNESAIRKIYVIANTLITVVSYYPTAIKITKLGKGHVLGY